MKASAEKETATATEKEAGAMPIASLVDVLAVVAVPELPLGEMLPL